jgi:hypothetical protein
MQLRDFKKAQFLLWFGAALFAANGIIHPLLHRHSDDCGSSGASRHFTENVVSPITTNADGEAVHSSHAFCPVCAGFFAAAACESDDFTLFAEHASDHTTFTYLAPVQPVAASPSRAPPVC